MVTRMDAFTVFSMRNKLYRICLFAFKDVRPDNLETDQVLISARRWQMIVYPLETVFFGPG